MVRNPPPHLGAYNLLASQSCGDKCWPMLLPPFAQGANSRIPNFSGTWKLPRRGGLQAR
jgi:hypothetical protein